MHSSREELTVTERCDAVFDSAHAMDISDLEDVRRQEVEYRGKRLNTEGPSFVQ